jgi:hypothetical protein
MLLSDMSDDTPTATECDLPSNTRGIYKQMRDQTG